MTTATPEDLTRTGLDARTLLAWTVYREHLLELDGIAYDEAERAEWEHLQIVLKEIAAERAVATGESAGPAAGASSRSSQA